ncbi:MAG: IS200/IS605 family transposase [Hungatella sp.]|jgi:putative transposase|nr:IS200/IS605 family transposase [Hungatella sp.]
MIETHPKIALSDLVRTMKSYTTFHIRKYHESFLRKHFWKERTFWTDGYFICSVDNVSEATLRQYIENQG